MWGVKWWMRRVKINALKINSDTISKRKSLKQTPINLAINLLLELM